MPVVFKNPDLNDYFVERPDVEAGATAVAPIIEAYEAPKVVVFPRLKLDIDFAFWERLPSDGYPLLKKLSSSASPEDLAQDALLDRKLAEVGLPAGLEQALRAEMLSIYRQVLPIYEQVFAGYRFTRRQVVWRLNTIRNENLHIDTYKQLFPEHFARLFINLDSQPRIWTTSYTSDELADRYAPTLSPEAIAGDGGAVFVDLNRQAFGGKTAIWWDRQPRHMVYFDPGDVWCVDSRQVAHQVLYGRRAVSFDFFVDPASMRDPRRHYLSLAESYRARAPRAEPVPA